MAVLASASGNVLAQAPHRMTFQGTLALGGGSMGLSGLVSGAIRLGHRVATLRLSGNLPPAGRPVATDFAVLAGYTAPRRRVLFAFGVGVALVMTGDSSRIYGAPYNGRTGIGLPLQVAALWRHAADVGIGAIGIADVNARRSFGSLLLGLTLGRLD